MINKISISTVQNCFSNSKTISPSFGFAKLNTTGREAADSFGYTENQFLDANMYRKQGIFKKPTLAQKLNAGESFTDICTAYGCTNNAKANAEFVVTQILPGKSSSVLSKIESEQLKEGLTLLYKHNYDNPELSTKDTSKLLDKLKGLMEADEYIYNVGVLKVGTDK